MNAPQDPAQGDGSHLPHGSVTAELVRLRARVVSLRSHLTTQSVVLRQIMSDCDCDVSGACAQCKRIAMVVYEPADAR